MKNRNALLFAQFFCLMGADGEKSSVQRRRRRRRLFSQTSKPNPSTIITADIVGGSELSPIPSYYATSLPPYALCGAVLIHSKYLLTAAHCDIAFRESALLVGSNTVVEIQTQHIHPLYNASDAISHFQYDLMILELRDTVVDSAPALMSYDAEINPPSPGSSVWTMGYGATTNNTNDDTKPSETLQHVNLTVISITECHDAYAAIGVEERLTQHRVFCTHDPALVRDACRGDSGSPVLRRDDNRLIGIVSWGRNCAGAYPAVHMMLDWDFLESVVPPCETTQLYASDGYYSFHYYWEQDNNEPRCIDLRVNRMFRAWKSMDFSCGSCAERTIVP